jgi:hypothetical protein
LPSIPVGSVVGLAGTDTVDSLSITCSTTYTLGALPGTYPTSCVAGSNPNNAYTITYVSGTLTVTPATATMISPVQGSTLTSPSTTFTWTTIPGASLYLIYVGTAVGANNLGGAQGATLTSYTDTNIPNTGRTIYVRLYTSIGGGWQYLDYTYTAPIPPPPAKATMISPTPGSTLTSPSATFTWNLTGASAYLIYVGTAPGSNNLGGQQGGATFNSYTFTKVPTNGRTIYVRLYTSIPGAGWQYNDYTYTAP